MPQAKRDLAELVAFKSVADPKQFPPEECAKAAHWVVDAFAAAGLAGRADARRRRTARAACTATRPGPQGAPTVLLYCHYDVQPPLGERRMEVPGVRADRARRPLVRARRGGLQGQHRHAPHRAARAQAGNGGFPCTVKLICEGSEEQGTGGLEAFVPENADLLRADAILVVDTGNFAVGVPTLTSTLRGMTSVDVTVRGLASAMHSGMFGGPAPDSLVALIQMLGSLHDAHGNTTIDGLDATQSWDGVEYAAEQFRADATVLDGVGLMGDGSVADLLWARPSATVIGIDAPHVIGSANALQASATARVSLRLPPGMTGQDAQDALVAHLEARVPWGMRCEIERVALGDPFVGSLDGPAVRVAEGRAGGGLRTRR